MKMLEILSILIGSSGLSLFIMGILGGAILCFFVMSIMELFLVDEFKEVRNQK